jgi:hypothetical protein
MSLILVRSLLYLLRQCQGEVMRDDGADDA